MKERKWRDYNSIELLHKIKGFHDGITVYRQEKKIST